MESLFCVLYFLLIGSLSVNGQGGRSPFRGRSHRGSTTAGWSRTTPSTASGGWHGTGHPATTGHMGGGGGGGFSNMGHMNNMNGFMNPMMMGTNDHGLAPSGTIGSGGHASHASQMLALANMKLSMGDNFNFNPNPPEVVYSRCPRFTTLHRCTINPCPTRCKRYPTAKCVTNPCGGCAPEWYIGPNRILDCD